jgi:nucleotide-binding universal stress UspA family protein
MGSGPTVIGFDGSPAAEHALRAAGALLNGNAKPRRALVLVVAKVGLGFEVMELPAATIGLPPAPIDVRTAIEIDEEIQKGAQRLAQRGADLAREAGFEADGLVVAEDLEIPVAETIVSVAREQDAEAVVVGAHGHSRVGEAILGSTSRDVIRRADCPVVVARKPSGAAPQRASSDS